MNKFKKLLAILLAACLALTCFAFVACDGKPSGTGGDKEVDKITVSKQPTTIVYNVGDTFSVEGGEITVTYKDGTTAVVALTAEDVTIQGVVPGDKLAIADEDVDSEEKTITVRYGKKSARFTVTVSHAMIAVTLDYNYTGSTAGSASVRKGNTVSKPANPTRDGYTFDNWYTDSTLTMAYDFETAVQAAFTLYAKWLDNSATYYEVSFDNNYAGSLDPVVQKVKSGDKAVKLATDPTREGYTFSGWYAEAAGTNAYSFDAAVSAATTVYAKWTRIGAAEVKEYLFEAEYTDLDGKSGPGLSSSAPGTAMIQAATNLGASNDRFIGYQYSNACTLEFQIVSDSAVSDAKIVLRLSAEIRDFNMNPSNYSVYLNGNPITYNEIEFKNVPTSSGADVNEVKALQFKDYVIAENVSLLEGLNTVQLLTDNEHTLEGTTLLADAPLIDCLKISTSAILTWSTVHGLPKLSNIK